MTKLEMKLINFVKRYIDILFLFAVLFIAIAIRYVGRDYVSGDMNLFLQPWFGMIKNSGGIHSLKNQVGDYNLLYQTIISLFTYLGDKSIYYYKILSIIFDFILAVVGGIFVCELKGKRTRKLFVTTFSIIIMLPTVILNSSFWGQCDSIYTTFVLLTIMYLYKEKYFRSFVFLGIAFAFKFQTIFIIPFIVCYYLYKKKFSLLYFLVSIIIFWSSGIAAYLQGRSLLDPFRLYMNQTDSYRAMYMNFPSFWHLLGNNYDFLKKFAILLALFICGFGLYIIIKNNIDCQKNENYIAIASWFVWACILFLPAMHERYAYLLDILFVILACLNSKYIRYCFVAVTASMITYGNYLFQNGINNKYVVVVYFIMFIYYSYVVFIKKLEL